MNTSKVRYFPVSLAFRTSKNNEGGYSPPLLLCNKQFIIKNERNTVS